MPRAGSRRRRSADRPPQHSDSRCPLRSHGRRSRQSASRSPRSSVGRYLRRWVDRVQARVITRPRDGSTETPPTTTTTQIITPARCPRTTPSGRTRPEAITYANRPPPPKGPSRERNPSQSVGWDRRARHPTRRQRKPGKTPNATTLISSHLCSNTPNPIRRPTPQHMDKAETHRPAIIPQSASPNAS